MGRSSPPAVAALVSATPCCESLPSTRRRNSTPEKNDQGNRNGNKTGTGTGKGTEIETETETETETEIGT
jgi:hypothetical protein